MIKMMMIAELFLFSFILSVVHIDASSMDLFHHPPSAGGGPETKVTPSHILLPTTMSTFVVEGQLVAASSGGGSEITCRLTGSDPVGIVELPAQKILLQAEAKDHPSTSSQQQEASSLVLVVCEFAILRSLSSPQPLTLTLFQQEQNEEGEEQNETPLVRSWSRRITTSLLRPSYALTMSPLPDPPSSAASLPSDNVASSSFFTGSSQVNLFLSQNGSTASTCANFPNSIALEVTVHLMNDTTTQLQAVLAEEMQSAASTLHSVTAFDKSYFPLSCKDRDIVDGDGGLYLETTTAVMSLLQNPDDRVLLRSIFAEAENRWTTAEAVTPKVDITDRLRVSFSLLVPSTASALTTMDPHMIREGTIHRLPVTSNTELVAPMSPMLSSVKNFSLLVKQKEGSDADVVDHHLCFFVEALTFLANPAGLDRDSVRIQGCDSSSPTKFVATDTVCCTLRAEDSKQFELFQHRQADDVSVAQEETDYVLQHFRVFFNTVPIRFEFEDTLSSTLHHQRKNMSDPVFDSWISGLPQYATATATSTVGGEGSSSLSATVGLSEEALSITTTRSDSGSEWPLSSTSQLSTSSSPKRTATERTRSETMSPSTPTSVTQTVEAPSSSTSTIPQTMPTEAPPTSPPPKSMTPSDDEAPHRGDVPSKSEAPTKLVVSTIPPTASSSSNSQPPTSQATTVPRTPNSSQPQTQVTTVPPGTTAEAPVSEQPPATPEPAAMTTSVPTTESPITTAPTTTTTPTENSSNNEATVAGVVSTTAPSVTTSDDVGTTAVPSFSSSSTASPSATSTTNEATTNAPPLTTAIEATTATPPTTDSTGPTPTNGQPDIPTPLPQTESAAPLPPAAPTMSSQVPTATAPTSELRTSSPQPPTATPTSSTEVPSTLSTATTPPTTALPTSQPSEAPFTTPVVSSTTTSENRVPSKKLPTPATDTPLSTTPTPILSPKPTSDDDPLTVEGSPSRQPSPLTEETQSTSPLTLPDDASGASSSSSSDKDNQQKETTSNTNTDVWFVPFVVACCVIALLLMAQVALLIWKRGSVPDPDNEKLKVAVRRPREPVTEEGDLLEEGDNIIDLLDSSCLHTAVDISRAAVASPAPPPPASFNPPYGAA